MHASGGASVIIRVRDEQHSLERCLRLLGGQRGVSGGVEVIVVDSGSEDQSVAVAERHSARVAFIPTQRFTFGGALNMGAQLARHEVLVSLSAHAFPRDDGWLARLVGAVSDADVACACGDLYGPDGVRLPPQYALFGAVVSGGDVVTKIDALGTRSGKPTEDVVIESVTIAESD